MSANDRDPPITEGIFDVVAGGVYEHSALIPTSTLHSHVLYHSALSLELTVAY